MHEQLLGRSPTAAEVASATTLLTGFSRLVIATAIANSTEARAYLINTWYSTFAHRAPAAGELAWWQALYTVGFTDQQIMGGIMTLNDVEAATQN